MGGIVVLIIIVTVILALVLGRRFVYSRIMNNNFFSFANFIQFD